MSHRQLGALGRRRGPLQAVTVGNRTLVWACLCLIAFATAVGLTLA